MNDMTKVITPKSDQLNADDLLTGPKTIKITGVTIKGGQEQPISVHYEGDNGKPYKACKSMCRVMVAAWGADSSKYAGRSMTLYCDPKVRWAGIEVGGIRISHMSDIHETITMALTVTKGSKKPYVIKPLTGYVNQPEQPRTMASPFQADATTEPSPELLRLTFLQDTLDKWEGDLNPNGVEISRLAIAAKDHARISDCLKSLRKGLEPKGVVFPEVTW